MKRLACRNAKKGLMVSLTHPNPGYMICGANPAVGSQYECIGEITGVNLAARAIRVIWNNGQTNEYSDRELSTLVVDEEETGVYCSIW